MTDKQINAAIQHDTTPEYACKVLAELKGMGMTTVKIARRIGVHHRSIHRFAEMGFKKFETQYILERLAGMR